jgi:hypothetical protein
MVTPTNVLNLKKDLTGVRYGRLVVTGFDHRDARGKAYWRAICDCGKIKVAAGYNLGLKVNSCGCLQQESRLHHSTTHGKRNTATYHCWAGMMQRCNNPNTQFFARYGGRGIKVCEKWKTFAGFLEDMGDRPVGMTIERIDNSLGYTKENCVWACRKTQARNRSTSKLIAYDGRTQSLAAWAVEVCISYATLHARIHTYGWSTEKAFTTPVKKSTKPREAVS